MQNMSALLVVLVGIVGSYVICLGVGAARFFSAVRVRREVVGWMATANCEKYFLFSFFFCFLSITAL